MDKQEVISKNLHFKNKDGHLLSARLEMIDRPKFYGIYANCFTCTKNITAAHVICRDLAKDGIAMLRFDFMGLGESEGLFENSSLTSNINDIVSASNYLENEYETPTLLIGHSLGGLASLYATEKIKNIKACVTLNAPSSTIHMKKRVVGEYESILENGYGQIDVMGKHYQIKKTFIEELQHYITLNLDFLKIPLLVLQVPDDPIVPAHHAQHIFEMANTSKSLISLDGMDHLIKNRQDGEKVAAIIKSWFDLYHF